MEICFTRRVLDTIPPKFEGFSGRTPAGQMCTLHNLAEIAWLRADNRSGESFFMLHGEKVLVKFTGSKAEPELVEMDLAL